MYTLRGGWIQSWYHWMHEEHGWFDTYIIRGDLFVFRSNIFADAVLCVWAGEFQRDRYPGFRPGNLLFLLLGDSCELISLGIILACPSFPHFIQDVGDGDGKRHGVTLLFSVLQLYKVLLWGFILDGRHSLGSTPGWKWIVDRHRENFHGVSVCRCWGSWSSAWILLISYFLGMKGAASTFCLFFVFLSWM